MKNNTYKIKIFNDTYDSEKKINQWLQKNNNIKIKKIVQSETGSVDKYSFTISILYKDKGNIK